MHLKPIQSAILHVCGCPLREEDTRFLTSASAADYEPLAAMAVDSSIILDDPRKRATWTWRAHACVQSAIPRQTSRAGSGGGRVSLWSWLRK